MSGMNSDALLAELRTANLVWWVVYGPGTPKPQGD